MNIVRYGFGIASSGYNLIKKIFLVFIVLYIILWLFTYFIGKSRPKISFNEYAKRQEQVLYKEMFDPEVQKTPEGRFILGVRRGIMCALAGDTCTHRPEDAKKFKDSSLFGSVTNWMAAPYSAPPASGMVWAQASLEKAGFISRTYASEGVGFSSIRGYMTLWTLFRNIAFLLLVLVMVIIGFLIMFRVKIDPQTVITLENALPRIALTMIYISFSFAIAGFLIDLMYILIGVSVDLILGYGAGMSKVVVITSQNDLIGAKFHDLWPNGFGPLNTYAFGSAFWDLIPNEFKTILDFFLIRNMAKFLAHINWEPLSTIIQGINGLGVATIVIGDIVKIPVRVGELALSGLLTYLVPGLILALLIVMTILLLMFRIFFILLGAYIRIILYIIFAPVILLLDAIPGRNMFGWWLKNIVAELIVFPTVVVMMLVGQAIIVIHTSQTGDVIGSFGTSYFNYLGNKSNETFMLPFLYGFNPDDFNFIVALGIVLLTPDFIKLVRSWLGVTETPFNLTLGTYFAGGTALASGAMGGLTGFAQLRSSLVGQDLKRGIASGLEDVPVVGGIVQWMNKSVHGNPKPTRT